MTLTITLTFSGRRYQTNTNKQGRGRYIESARTNSTEGVHVRTARRSPPCLHVYTIVRLYVLVRSYSVSCECNLRMNSTQADTHTHTHTTERDYLSLQIFNCVYLYKSLYFTQNRTFSFSSYRVRFLTELPHDRRVCHGDYK